MASWMVSELFAAGGHDVAVTLTPGEAGVFTVKLDDDLVFDKASEGNQTPHLGRVKEIKAERRNRIDAVTTSRK